MSLVWNGELYRERVEQAAMRGVARWLGMLDQRWVDLVVNSSKSGRVYRRRGVSHQASAPGEPPASDTGSLVASRAQELDPQRLAGRFKIMSRHALPLELGTRNMEPRPHARRALAETREDGEAAVAAEIAAVLR